MFRALTVSIYSILVSTAFGTSVWDDTKNEAYKVVGKVVSIATNNNEILVRIFDGSNTETYKLCSAVPGGDPLNLSESERMKSIRSAFDRGDIVSVSYNGPFDHCLSRVEITKPTYF